MEDVLGYSAMGRELEKSALVNVFREWREGWERNLKLFHHLPDEVQESIMAGSDDFVAATNMIMTSWVFLHPNVQRQHVEYMHQLEDLAASVVSSGLGTLDDMEDRVAELEQENEQLRGTLRILRASVTAALGDGGVPATQQDVPVGGADRGVGGDAGPGVEIG